MSTKTTWILLIAIILAGTLMGLLLWPRLPTIMASHWNIENEVDGYTPRVWGVLMLPLVALGTALLFWLIPRIDPLKHNIASFRGTFNTFIFLLTAFLVYLYLLTLVYNLGYTFTMGTAILPALGAFFFYAGILIGKAKRNWFIGIRTPWTLSSDKVWDETHRLGAILFKVSGVLAALGVLFGRYAFWFILLPLLGSSLFLVIYSYVLYRKENHPAA